MTSTNVEIVLSIDISINGQILNAYDHNGSVVSKQDYDPNKEYSLSVDSVISIHNLPIGGITTFDLPDGSRASCWFVPRYVNCFAVQNPLTDFDKLYIDDVGLPVKLERFENNVYKETVRLEERQPDTLQNVTVKKITNNFQIFICEIGNIRKAIMIGSDDASPTGYSIWGN